MYLRRIFLRYKFFKRYRYKLSILIGKTGSYYFCIKGPLGLGWIKFSNNILYGIKYFLFFSKKYCYTVLSVVRHIAYGFHKGFYMGLKTEGVGYKFIKIKGYDNIVSLYLGFGHAMLYRFPINMKFRSLKYRFFLFSTSYPLLINTILNLRSYRIPDPYKSKGIKFLKEALRLKPGKQRQR